MFTTLHDSRGEYDAPAKFRMPSTKSIVGALESVCGFFASAYWRARVGMWSPTSGEHHPDALCERGLCARVLCVLCGMQCSVVAESDPELGIMPS